MKTVRIVGEGNNTSAIGKALTAIGWVQEKAAADALVIAVANDDLVDAVTSAITQTRAAADAGAGVVLLMLEANAVPLTRSMLRAAIETLAIECAPNTRIAALDIAPDAESADVAAAALFLLAAESMTGQVIRITPSGVTQ